VILGVGLGLDGDGGGLGLGGLNPAAVSALSVAFSTPLIPK